MDVDKRSNYRAENPVVIVTGCGSGIGYELAKKLYFREDLNVIITARSKSLDFIKQNFLETNRFLIRKLDITNNDNIYSLIHEVSSLWGRVDVIINNAAVCFRAVIEHMDVESEMLQLKTNYLGPMALIRSVLPIMREQRSGIIINVSSVSGMLAMPTMGSYSASKHALDGATEALWYEAKPFGIKVNLVQLGFINSNSFKKVQLSRKAQLSLALGGPHSEYYKSMTPMIEKLMHFSFFSSETIAKKIIKLIDNPKSQLRLPLTPDAIIFGIIKKIIPSMFLNRLLYLLLPGSMTTWGGRWKASQSKSKKLSSLQAEQEL
jgi:short-subunit dehydrogenase